MSWWLRSVEGVAVFEGTGSDVGLIRIRPRRLHIHVAGFWMF